MNRPRRIPGAALAILGGVALSSVGCNDDPVLETLVPVIEVCADEASPSEACNVGFDLGGRYATLPSEVRLVVRNAGDAPLLVSEVLSDRPELVVGTATLLVEAGEEAPATLQLTPAAEGPGLASLRFESDDPERTSLVVPVQWTGTPPPTPRFEVCSSPNDLSTCGTDVVIDFGVVRRTQRESRTVLVRNAGTAPVQILAVEQEDGSTSPGELSVASWTRPGELPAGGSAELVVIYEPYDGLDDTMALHFTTDDPMAVSALVTLRGASDGNAPPLADAREELSGSTSLDVTVGDTVVLDGTASIDPEGDPLQYSWTLQTPAQSAADLNEADAARVSFVPDRAGSYRAELVVFDSLQQASEVAAVVLMTALPSTGLRVDLMFAGSGDADLHLLPVGEQIFSENDCFFENPRPDWGTVGVDIDDPELLEDAESGPGTERIVFAQPADGDYRVVVHHFAGSGALDADVQVTFDDASFPDHEGSQSLSAACTAWEVGIASFPQRVFTPSDQLSDVCYGDSGG